MSESLYIIDGHAQIYRSYYAVLGLKSPTGEPTNATFGFVGMMLKLLQTRKPTHIVLAMDAGTSGRETMDATYKAQRKPMPEDMPPQIERILQIVDIMGIPIFMAEGFEADDAIATLVRKVRQDPVHAKARLYMCTKDKDLDQLIDDGDGGGGGVVMYDIQTNEEIDSKGLMAKKGYLPTQARDVLALTGDNVDNIPGVPGVGPKTAAKWIAQYGSIDNLLAHKDEVGGKVGEALRGNLAVLENARKMVELLFDVPIPTLDWDATRVAPEKWRGLAPIFQQLGFAKLMTLLDQVVGQYRDLIPAAVPSAAALPKQPAIAKAPAAPKPVKKESIPGGLFDQSSDDSAAGEDTATASRGGSQEVSNEEEMPLIEAPAGLQPVQGTYVLVNTPEKVEEMLVTLREQLDAAKKEEERGGPTAWLSLDTETDALGAMVSNLCGISLSAKEGTGYYVAVKGANDDVLDPVLVRERLGPLLGDPSIKKLGQNIKYDLNALRNFGIEVRGVHFDTMVASYVIDSSRLSHGMDAALAADLLGLRPIPITDLIGRASQQVSFADVPLSRAAHYAAEDADVTLRLGHVLAPQLKKLEREKLFHDLEMPLVQVLADMERHGVMIDTALLKKLSVEIETRLYDLEKKIKAAAGMDFNQDSPRQLADVLFKHLKLPVIKKTKVGPSTDITVLEKLSDKHPVPALIVEYRQLAKLKNTYLDTLSKLPNPRTGRVHASFNQTVAETGRLSSSDPNLQNIPIKTDIGREIRRAFIAAPGYVLVSADYSQIELRVLAHYCGEKALIEAFAGNRDVHRLVAAELNHVPEEQVTSEMRAVAKTVNFGIIYGQTGFGLAEVLKISKEEANAYITAYRRRFPAIEQFTHECITQASAYGHVTTILGRHRAIPDINSAVQSRRMFGQRAALNSVIQGSAADLIKLAMVNIQRKIVSREDDIRMILQIHDELVFEVRAEHASAWQEMIRTEMESAMALKVPLKVDTGVGKNWLEYD